MGSRLSCVLTFSSPYFVRILFLFFVFPKGIAAAWRWVPLSGLCLGAIFCTEGRNWLVLQTVFKTGMATYIGALHGGLSVLKNQIQDRYRVKVH
jgi:hypothetical protein